MKAPTSAEALRLYRWLIRVRENTLSHGGIGGGSVGRALIVDAIVDHYRGAITRVELASWIRESE